MKKIVLITSMLLVIFMPTVFAQEPPGVSAKAAVVLCADNGKVLYSKNEKEQLSMASTTKIMTALLTLEAAEADNKEITVTQQMVAVEGTSMGLQVGDVVTLDTLAKGMLLCSGNDAANAAALSLADSQEAFARMMNEKAAQIGMKGTNFVTPSGLDDENHYTTAYDMALLGAYAMEMQAFADIASQKSITVEFIKPAQRRTLSNHNKLLRLYDGCIGVKTGFTKKSGRCLVSCAERNGVRLIAVTLNAPDDWNDHQNLLDYGFSQLQSVAFDESGASLSVPVVGGTLNGIPLNPAGPVSATVGEQDASRIQRIVETPAFVYAPVEQGQLIGKIRYLLDGEEVASVNLTAGQSVPALEQEKNPLQRFWDWLCHLFE